MPSHIVMGHELGHVWDVLRAGNNRRNFTQIPNASEGITLSEVNAMYWENVLRLHSNLPLRLSYNYANGRVIDTIKPNSKGGTDTIPRQY